MAHAIFPTLSRVRVGSSANCQVVFPDCIPRARVVAIREIAAGDELVLSESNGLDEEDDNDGEFEDEGEDADGDGSQDRYAQEHGNRTRPREPTEGKSRSSENSKRQRIVRGG